MNSTQRAKKYRNKIRKELRVFLGEKCSKCGTTENLEFDHIDPKNKIMAIGTAIVYKSSQFVWEEVQKCQLLCKPCHKEKNKIDNGEAQHGTRTMYTHHSCRCDDCRLANRTYNREQKRRYRKMKKQSSCSSVGRAID